MELTGPEKRILLSAARESIKSIFEDTSVQSPNYNMHPDLKLNAGAFVTLRINSELKGCIGYIISKTPLFETVCEAAKQAAFNDPRFFPLEEEELPKVNIEISVLSIPVPINSYEEIIIGKHGLILEEDGHRGLLLPQVASENNFTREQFLTAICEKAMVFPELWKDKKLKINIFTAAVFSEEDEEERQI